LRRVAFLLALIAASVPTGGLAQAEAPDPAGRTSARGLISGPNFVFVPAKDSVAEAACTPHAIADTVLFEALERVRRAGGLDPQIAIVLATNPLSCGDIFYVPVANDVRGIGYQHADPRELFDDSPDSRLEGVAFLNDFAYWKTRTNEFAYDFNHEVAHRWGTRVQLSKPGVAANALLGRQEMHWSYFLDTQSSPLEGNTWTELGDRFRADTPLASGRFSGFDLYLMGVLPASEVAPQRLLSPYALADESVDCRSNPLTAASPPQWCEPVEIRAQPVTIGIEDIIAAEGERLPAADVVPKVIDVSVVVLESGTKPFDPSECSALSQALQQRFIDFEQASGGRLKLRNLTLSNASCEDWPAVPNTGQASQGCSIGRPGQNASSAIVVLLAVLGLRRRLGPLKCESRARPPTARLL
jgi:hypothetical protein